MREVNYRLPLEGTAPSPVLFGVARGLEDLFPILDHPRFQDGEEEADAIAIEGVTEGGEGGRRTAQGCFVLGISGPSPLRSS